MARTATPTKPDPTRRYRAWQGFSSPAGTVRAGEIRYGSDPVVAAAFSNWVPEETLLSEQPTPWDRVLDEHEERERERQAILEQAARQNPITLEAPKLARAREDFVVEAYGRPPRPALIKAGSIVLATDPVAVSHGHHFDPVD